KLVSLPKLREQLLLAVPTEWNKEKAANYLQETKTRFVAYLAAAVLSDDALHDIRKLLKDLLYVWPYLEGAVAEIFPPQYFNKETCLQLTEKLGSYQDCCIALSLFRPDLLHNRSAEEQHQLVILREMCSRRKEGERKALLTTLLLLKNEVRTTMQVQPPFPVSAGNPKDPSSQE
ncbi:MAG: CHAD domain-containing protein, partial [Chitinophagaceae bacterium]